MCNVYVYMYYKLCKLSLTSNCNKLESGNYELGWRGDRSHADLPDNKNYLKGSQNDNLVQGLLQL